MSRIGRQAYAEMYGPTVGDRIRLADTALFIAIERDHALYGEEVKFGGGKVIRDGRGQSQRLHAQVADTVSTNAVIVDHWGIVKADIGLKDGMIAAAQMGDPNASIPTPQPVHARPMFGAFGGALRKSSCTFVSQAALRCAAAVASAAGVRPTRRHGRARLERTLGVETGGCPHTAIREDASINLEAIARMSVDFPQLDLILIESGGDNLAATFSPELSDLTIYVIDVAGGEKIPRKGGPGITRSDLLVINKTDLAPHVGANLEVMRADAARMRGARPFVFTSLRHGAGIDDIVAFIRHQGLLDAAHTNHQPEEL